MKKLKLWIASIVLLSCLFSISKTLAAIDNPIPEIINGNISIPDSYFTNTNAIPENYNHIYFSNSWNDWYWLFFLWTWINWSFSITNGATTLNCSWQLNWYYTISFANFSMFPLDTTTNANNNPVENIEWWLYYNCRKNSTIYTWVYGHIKWTYNSGNTHEIRAWVNGNTFRGTSPLQIIYSDKSWNSNVGLSWYFQDNLGKKWVLSTRFFWDIWIKSWSNEIIPLWTTSDPYYLLPYETYQNAQIYVKSSKVWTWNITINKYNNNNQLITPNINSNFTLTNQITPYWFYGYKDNIISIPYDSNLKSWTINVTINSNSNETRSKSIRFLIDSPILTAPTFSSITISPICSGTITITTNITQNVWTFNWTVKYGIIDNLNLCNSSSNINNNYPTTGVPLSNESFNNKVICFKATNDAWTTYSWKQITWIDTSWPTFTFLNNSWNECVAWSLSITNANDICLWLHAKPYKFEGWSWWTINTKSIPAQQTWWNTVTITWYVRDTLQHTSTWIATYTFNDVAPTANNFSTWNIWSSTKTITLAQFISASNATEWSCGTSNLSYSGVKTNGTKWTCSIVGNTLTYTPNNNNAWNDTCVITIKDNENSTVDVTVTFNGIDTTAPLITINTQPNPLNQCSTSKTISGTLNEAWTMRYKTGRDVTTVCTWAWPTSSNYTPWQNLTFNSENDSWIYVCFKARDLSNNITYKTSAVITGIDRTAPTFNLTGIYEVFECETWIIQITGINRTWCAGLHAQPYYRSRQNWTNWDRSTNIQSGFYKNGTWTQTVYIKVRDIVWNSWRISQVITRKNREIIFSWWNDILDIWYITEDYVFNNANDIISQFQLTWRWSCETIQIQTWQCQKASRTWWTNQYIIHPNDDLDQDWQCIIYFKDWDTTLTWKITFAIKTKKYYISLATTGGYSSWHLKLKNNETEFDTWKISLYFNDYWRYNSSNTLRRLIWNNYYTIWNISTINLNNKWLSSWNIDIPITLTDINNLDSVFNGLNQDQKCSLFNYEIELATWFITDPAWVPSSKTSIRTDNLYIYGNYLTIAGTTWTSYTKEVAKWNWIDHWIEIPINTKTWLSVWTSSITCIPSDTCPGFSCNKYGITSQMHDIYGGTPWLMILNEEEIEAQFYYTGTLKIDELDTSLVTPVNRELRTGCIIKLTDDNWCDRQITLDINLKSFPIKAWEFWEEDYWEGDLNSALVKWSWDNWFMFFITHPQNLKSGGIIWNIWYTINFSSWVAAEYYYITWSATINWFKEEIFMRRPVNNFYNPRTWSNMLPTEF